MRRVGLARQAPLVLGIAASLSVALLTPTSGSANSSTDQAQALTSPRLSLPAASPVADRPPAGQVVPDVEAGPVDRPPATSEPGPEGDVVQPPGSGPAGGATPGGPAGQGSGDGAGSGPTADPGNGSGSGSGSGPGGPTPPATPPTDGAAARRCFDASRQTFAVYSGPCAAGFEGDNGGATARGVTATEFRIGYVDANATAGPVPQSARPNESAADRTLRVLQRWFNERYQFYGRQLQLFVEPGTDAQAAAAKVREEYGGFGIVYGGGSAAGAAGPGAGLVTFGDYSYPRATYLDRSPYLWTFGMDNDRTVEFAAEYMCTKLAGKPAAYTDDPLLTPPLVQTRRFGALYYADDGYDVNGPALEAAARARCGLDVVTAGYTLSDPSTLGTAVTALRQAGVTTTAFFADFVTGGRALAAATAQGWFPEWLVVPFGGVDVNTLALTMPQEQWRNAFGFTSREIPRSVEQAEWYQAYQQVDPGGVPDTATATAAWFKLTMFANGVQAAGPALTPDSFRTGLLSIPRTPPRATYATGGGFGATDPSYIDYVAEIWWDVQSRAYRFTGGGARFAPGEIPSDTSQLFVEGVTTG